MSNYIQLGPEEKKREGPKEGPLFRLDSVNINSGGGEAHRDMISDTDAAVGTARPASHGAP